MRASVFPLLNSIVHLMGQDYIAFGHMAAVGRLLLQVDRKPK